jgi:hypothetical protein
MEFMHFPSSGHTVATIHMRVKNMGRTPARVTNAAMTLSLRPTDEPLPEKPQYPKLSSDRALKAFLVTGAEAFTGDTLTLSPDDMKAIRETKTKTIYAIGYVDYIDRFKERHRSGAGYVYSREAVSERRTRATTGTSQPSSPSPTTPACPVHDGLRRT